MRRSLVSGGAELRRLIDSNLTFRALSLRMPLAFSFFCFFCAQILCVLRSKNLQDVDLFVWYFGPIAKRLV